MLSRDPKSVVKPKNKQTKAKGKLCEEADRINGTPAGYPSAQGKIASELAIGADALLAPRVSHGAAAVDGTSVWNR